VLVPAHRHPPPVSLWGLGLVKEGDPSRQGTWAHPLVIITVGQGGDTPAEVRVTQAVFAWRSPGRVPSADPELGAVVANAVDDIQM
jgi:hypothetical protein